MRGKKRGGGRGETGKWVREGVLFGKTLIIIVNHFLFYFTYLYIDLVKEKTKVSSR